MNIDDMEGLDEETRKKIEELQKVTRERDGGEAFADAQFNIGKIFQENASDEEAIAKWRTVERYDDVKTYAKAQCNIGFLLERARNFEKALLVWEAIQHKDYPPAYAKAQVGIGLVLKQKKDLKGALSIWGKVKRSDDLVAYARAQFNTAILFQEMDDNRKSLYAWRKIEYSDDENLYAAAQFNIGLVLIKQNNVEEALSTWSNIKRFDNTELYARAKFNTGFLLKYRVELEGAMDEWGEIKRSDSLNIFYSAQFEIGKTLLDKNVEKSALEAKKYFLIAKQLFSYESHCYIKICDLLRRDNDKVSRIKYLRFFERILKTVDILKIKFIDSNSKSQCAERKLAHYTSTDVANILLDEVGNKEPTKKLRLNTISNMNDPSEGQLLKFFLNKEKDTVYNSADFDERFHAFFSCFTFNHDSLNQFRLYGKKDYLEASGVSLVFTQKFFQDNNSGGLSFLSIDSFSQKLTGKSISPDFGYDDIENQDKSNSDLISKKQVMRCIYLDPESGYIQLAQRNRLTFYREFDCNNIIVDKGKDYAEKSLAEEMWENYSDEMAKKTNDFIESFNILKSDYEKIVSENTKIRESSLDKFNELEVLLDEILLPLKYLIKHSAFQEEQECRMIYITSLDKPEVKMEFGRFLYVEYEPDVKQHLDKIYIAPAATQYQPYLAKLLCDTNVKIELSNNPYRQTS
ncbi:tetratricopeptide repeat protein [Psychrobacter piscatorii]|uniref:tetratricopeptide repeat protein n=1 Tax=Psychrobacter piscatorii TaxID=554343 RepID=UPI003734C75A